MSRIIDGAPRPETRPDMRPDSQAVVLPVWPGLALAALLLALGACQRAPSDAAAPPGGPAQTQTAPPTGGGADSSLPDASSVLGRSDGPKTEPELGRSNSAMTRTQESSAMPLPGQNNDHSAPLPPAKRASGP